MKTKCSVSIDESSQNPTTRDEIMKDCEPQKRPHPTSNQPIPIPTQILQQPQNFQHCQQNFVLVQVK